MAGPDFDDLDVFLDVDGFAIEVVLRPGGDERRARVLYDEPFLKADLGEYDLDSSQPRITGRSCDLAAVSRGDECVVNGAIFIALGAAQPDGTGMSVVSLVRQEERSDARF